MTRKLIIDDIQATAFRMKLRDEDTGEVEDVAFDPKERFRISRAPVPRVTLMLDNAGGGGFVHITATGPGAAAWAEAKGRLIGTQWRTTASGAPMVIVDDKPDIVAEIEREAPEVTLDTLLYTPSTGSDEPAPAEPRPISRGPSSAAKRKRRSSGRRRASGSSGGRGGATADEEDDEDGEDVDAEELPLDADITLKLDNLNRRDGMVLVTASGKRVAEWTSRHKTLLGTGWESADGLPHALIMDDEDLAEQIRKEHPAVRLDLVEFVPRTRVELIRLEAEASKPITTAEPADMALMPDVGPGGLAWEPIEERGIDGVAARWRSGQFKILRAAGTSYALFYEYDGGGYVHMSCGPLRELKRQAGGSSMTESPRGSVNQDMARLACPVPVAGRDRAAQTAANEPPEVETVAAPPTSAATVEDPPPKAASRLEVVKPAPELEPEPEPEPESPPMSQADVDKALLALVRDSLAARKKS